MKIFTMPKKFVYNITCRLNNKGWTGKSLRLSKTQFEKVVLLSLSTNALDVVNRWESSQLPPGPGCGCGTVDSAFGSQIEDVIAKRMKTTPPTSVTAKRFSLSSAWNCDLSRYHSPVRTEIFWAIILPPTTPKPVQIAWPIIPPVITPIRFSRAARMIVVIWERSPHSATNVIVKACMKILKRTLKAPFFAFGLPISGSATRAASLFTYY